MLAGLAVLLAHTHRNMVGVGTFPSCWLQAHRNIQARLFHSSDVNTETRRCSHASEQMWTLRVLWLCPLVSLVSPCPAGCCCPGAGSLVLCESLGLRSLPRAVPLTTSALSVARNQLCNVDHQFLAFSALLELSLGHNLLSRVPRGLPSSLETLQLQENRIAYITSGALRKLGKLTRLDLEDNRIRAIQPGALEGLNKLQVLSLKGNRLTGLPRSLPPSLTHLDLSENCISALEPPSLSSLVNLQSLKLSSNCLRSVPESTFDSLARLRSLDLANNLWACRCGILYLYRWLLQRRASTAADLVCAEPAHLAHHRLTNLSVMEICPHGLRSPQRQKLDLPREGRLATLESRTPSRQTSAATSFGERSPPGLADSYSLVNISYQKCLSLTETQTDGQNLFETTLALSVGQQKFRDNTSGRYPDLEATSAQPLVATNRDAAGSAALPPAHTQPHSAVVVSLLALMCGLLMALTLLLLLLLKKVLLRQRRVAPLEAASGRRHQHQHTNVPGNT